VIRVSLHTTPQKTDLAGARGLITSRESQEIDGIAERLRSVGLTVRIVEGPVVEAPESDFWFVLADDVEWHLTSLKSVEGSDRGITSRFVLLRPGRDRAFALLEELDAAAAVEAYGADAWGDAPGGRLVVRREVARSLGGEMGIRLPYLKETPRHASWENPDYGALAVHLAKYLEAVAMSEANARVHE